MDACAFSIGTLDCIAVNDGDMEYDASEYVANAPTAEVASALELHGHQPDRIPSPYSGLVIRTDSHLVLIDTGAGGLTPDVGKLHGNLRRAGIEPNEIDTVVLTHGHPDHIGGNVDADGHPAFPNARHVMFRREWDYWVDEAILAGPLAVLRGVGEAEPAAIPGPGGTPRPRHRDRAGIEALEAAGHTPGHMAVAVRSGGDELLYISDAAIHPIHLEHPDWYPIWDYDPVAAVAAKRRLCERATSAGSLVLAFHFPPFPSLGHITKHDGGWQWEPVASAVTA